MVVVGLARASSQPKETTRFIFVLRALLFAPFFRSRADGRAPLTAVLTRHLAVSCGVHWGTTVYRQGLLAIVVHLCAFTHTHSIGRAARSPARLKGWAFG